MYVVPWCVVTIQQAKKRIIQQTNLIKIKEILM
jgi:hypothetical protein